MERHFKFVGHNKCAGCKSAKKCALLNNSEVSTLLECVGTNSQNKDLTDIFKTIFKSCKKIIGAQAGYFSLIDFNCNNSEIVFIDTVHANYDSVVSVPITGISAEACTTGKTFYTNTPPDDSWMVLLPKEHVHINNLMFIPITTEQKVSGLLVLANKQGGFTEEDVDLGVTLSKFASIALLNYEKTQKIMESEEKYRRLVEIFPESIMVVTTEEIIFANQAALRLFGANRVEDLTGKPLSLFISPDCRCVAQCRLHKAFLGENVEPIEKKVVRLDGSLVDVEITAAPFASQGKPASLVVMRDLTQRKLIEHQEQMATKLEAVSILAGGIAHDFNNLLTVVLGNLSIAKMYAGNNTKVFEKLHEIENAAMQTKELTRQLLTFVKENTLTKKAASLKELLREMIPFILHGTNVTSTLAFADDLPPVEIDTAQFSQVIQNIIINAVQAMPEGGTIQIEGKLVETFQSLCLPFSPGNYIELIIRDTGRGIEPESLERIFEPFYTTKEQGNGLGLATSYNIIKQHGGYIKAESTVGAGTTFYLYLPVSKKPIEQTLKEDRLFQGRGTILVMDDEEGVRKTAGEMLHMLGFDVEYASSGEDALKSYQEKISDGYSYDLVILDKTVRGGMGGQKTMEKLLFIDPEVKALISSGYANAPLLADCEKYGFQGFVSKPYKIEELSNLLKQILT